ncbi:MAG: thiosulfate oxidation carrier protein SoxY [Alphaproteobacteria bacterium]|nr:thiosulfate oxidation carrier protein SoxY [Alphaproteobacteria bacterium]
MVRNIGSSALDRRGFLAAGAALIATTTLVGKAARAALPEVEAAIKEILGDRTAEEGRISLDLPEIAENGNTVPLTVEVESPMTEDDYVAAVHIFAEGNPQPTVASMSFTPRSGEAIASTRIRLAKTQTIHAIAEMSDGSVFTATREVKVTIGGCGG